MIINSRPWARCQNLHGLSPPKLDKIRSDAHLAILLLSIKQVMQKILLKNTSFQKELSVKELAIK